MPRTLSATLAFISVLCLASHASAFSVSLSQGTSGGVLKWSDPAMTFHLHPACSEDLPNAGCLDEVRASFGAWEDVDCSVASFTEQGTSNSLASTALGYNTNGKNELAWIEDDQWFYGAYVLGVTGPVFYDDGQIIEADIVFNGYWHTWSTSGQAYSTDVRNVAVHEVGHYFGLGHVLDGQSEANPPTMAPSADPFMATRTPEVDDHAGLCFLYPANSWSCTNDTQCPLVVSGDAQGEYYAGQFLCSGGLCGGYSNTVQDGDAQLGEPCSGDASCAGDTFCQPIEDANAVCAVNCVPSAPNCPQDFVCFAYANAFDLGACLPLSMEGVGDAAVGEACTSSGQCETGLCVGEEGAAEAFCRAKCSTENDCAPGEICVDLLEVNFGACIPDSTAPDPATKELGEPCITSVECTTDLCAGEDAEYFCTVPCDSHLQCPDGWVCNQLAEGGGACMGAGTADTGAPCLTSTECLEGLGCVPFNQETDALCSAQCGDGIGCACGSTCSASSNGSGLWCAPGPKLGCVLDGELCAQASECQSGTCFEGLCRTPCSLIPSQAKCAPGSACLRLNQNTNEGYCNPTGVLPISSPCVVDASCQSLLCVEGRCALPCDPLQAAACSPGQICAFHGLVATCTVAPASNDDPTTVDDGPVPSDRDNVGLQIPIDPREVPFQSRPVVEQQPAGGCSGGGTSPASWFPTLLLLGLWSRRSRLGWDGPGSG